MKNYTSLLARNAKKIVKFSATDVKCLPETGANFHVGPESGVKTN
jgi:hypothetical protein